MTDRRHVVVLGIGNRWRRDDGVGPAVAAAVRRRIGTRVAVGVDVRELDGETTRIVDAWDGADVAVVIDAVRTGTSPGTVRHIDADALEAASPPSSHGLGVQHAVALGRAVNRMPRRLEIVGVEGGDFGQGAALSAPVAAAVESAASMVIALVEEERGCA